MKLRTIEEIYTLAERVTEMTPEDQTFINAELDTYIRQSVNALEGVGTKDTENFNQFTTRRAAYERFQDAIMTGTWRSGQGVEYFRNAEKP
jgi:hypothetical protein